MTQRAAQSFTARTDGSPDNSVGLAPFASQLLWAVLFFRRNIRWIVAGALVAAMLAALYVVRADPRFESAALLMIEEPDTRPLGDEQTRRTESTESFVAGQVFVVTSVDVLREATARLELTAEPSFQPSPPGLLARITGSGSAPDPDDHALRQLRKSVRVSQDSNSSVVRITGTAINADLAARIANTVAQVYIENRQTARAERAAIVATWLTDRTVGLQRQLAAAEAAVATYMAQNNLIQGRTGQTLSEQQLFDLNAELIRTRAAYAEKSASLARAESLVASGGELATLPQMDQSDVVSSLRSARLDLERTEVEYLRTSGESDPRLIQVRAEIADIDAQIANEAKRIVEVLRAEVGILGERDSLLSQAVAEAGGLSGIEGQTRVELAELERVAESYRALYERFLTAAGLARESLSYLSGGAEIISGAEPPLAPVFPPKKVLVILSFVLGGAVAALGCLVFEALRPGVRTPAQAEQVLGHPVVTSLPALPKGQNPIEMIENAPVSAYSEAVQVLRHSLLMDEGPLAPVVLVTSTDAGEGKTTIAASVAAAAHQAGQRVLIIDADFRRGGMTRHYGLMGDHGLSDILSGSSETNLFDANETAACIDMMPIGRQPINPADLLASPAMARFVLAGRRAYDLVIIDGPPVANMADAPVLARLAGQVIFVMGWNSTSRDAARAALTRLSARGPVSLVLNKVDTIRIASYGDSYGAADRLGSGKGIRAA